LPKKPMMIIPPARIRANVTGSYKLEHCF
jgi:hypothetical protein